MLAVIRMIVGGLNAALVAAGLAGLLKELGIIDLFVTEGSVLHYGAVFVIVMLGLLLTSIVNKMPSS